MKTFEVPVVYRGQINYIVKAKDFTEAENLVRTKWKNGDKGEVPIIEFEEIERIGDIEIIKDEN